MENKVNIDFLFFIFFGILAIFFPILSILILMTIVSYKYYFFNKIIIYFIIFLFAIINSSKFFDNDIVWYYEHYLWLLGNPLNEYFGTLISGVYAKQTEPLIYIIFKFIGFFIGSNKELFSIIFTLIPYFIILISSNKILKIQRVETNFFASGLILILCLGLNFTLSLHLLRQFLAEAIFLLAIPFLFQKKYSIFFLVLFISFLTHNSILYILFLTMIAYFFSVIDFKGKSILFPLTLIIFYLISLNISSYMLAYNNDLMYKNDGSVSYFVYAFDSILFFVVLSFYYLYKNKLDSLSDLFIKLTLYLYMINSVVLLGFSNIPLVYLRFGFYSEVVKVLLLCGFIKFLSFKFKYNPVILILSIFLGFSYVYLRMDSSDFNFSIDLKDIIFFNVFIG